jgi:hypothetical protein
MSRTASRTLSRCGAAAAGAVAVVLLAACGGSGGGGKSASSSPATAGTAQGSTTLPADQEFCAEAKGIDQRVESALSDLGGDGTSVPDGFRQIAVQLRAIDAPAEISADWAEVAAGLDRIAAALGDVDITDPSTLSALDAAEGDLTNASARVDQYLSDQCGIGK